MKYLQSCFTPQTWPKFAIEGKNHQDSAPTVVMVMVVDGDMDINLKIVKTPHFVYIIKSSAMLQHLGVGKDAFIAGTVDMLYNLVTN